MMMILTDYGDDDDFDDLFQDKEVFQSFAQAQVSVTNEIFEYLGHPKFLFCPTQVIYQSKSRCFCTIFSTENHFYTEFSGEIPWKFCGVIGFSFKIEKKFLEYAPK
jgi:hypothetical protein